MRRALLILAAATLVAGGCSSDDADEATTTTEAEEPSAESTTTTAVEAPAPLEDQTPPPSINGVTVQGDTLWIASIGGDQVIQVDRQSGAILARFETDGAGPDDVAVAPDGSVWVTGFGNGDVGRISDGSYEVVTTIAAGINPIDVADDGTVYIGTYGPDGSLYRISPGETEAELLAEGTMPDINGFALLDDGTIFAPAGGIAGPGSAVRIDPDGGEVSTIVDDLPGVAAGTIAPDATPYLLANADGQLIEVDIDAGTSEVARTISTGAPFDNLAFADDGMLYLTSFTAVAVTEVAPDGSDRVITVGG